MKTIEEMAREAGDDWDHTLKEDRKFLERFAALVLASADPQSSMAWQEGNKAGRLAEREACAKVADGYVGADPIADAIRARGQA
jgi:acyl-CoA reductase-like NAD-dependent aldehyde dehydrogenase